MADVLDEDLDPKSANPIGGTPDAADRPPAANPFGGLSRRVSALEIDEDMATPLPGVVVGKEDEIPNLSASLPASPSPGLPLRRASVLEDPDEGFSSPNPGVIVGQTENTAPASDEPMASIGPIPAPATASAPASSAASPSDTSATLIYPNFGTNTATDVNGLRQGSAARKDPDTDPGVANTSLPSGVADPTDPTDPADPAAPTDPLDPVTPVDNFIVPTPVPDDSVSAALINSLMSLRHSHRENAAVIMAEAQRRLDAAQAEAARLNGAVPPAPVQGQAGPGSAIGAIAGGIGAILGGGRAAARQRKEETAAAQARVDAAAKYHEDAMMVARINNQRLSRAVTAGDAFYKSQRELAREVEAFNTKLGASPEGSAYLKDLKAAADNMHITVPQLRKLINDTRDVTNPEVNTLREKTAKLSANPVFSADLQGINDLVRETEKHAWKLNENIQWAQNAPLDAAPILEDIHEIIQDLKVDDVNLAKPGTKLDSLSERFSGLRENMLENITKLIEAFKTMFRSNGPAAGPAGP